MSSKGQVSGQAVLGLLQNAIILGGLAAAVFLLREINTLLDLILGNIFYLTLIGVAGLGGAIILYRLVDQERISVQGAAAGYILIIGLTLAAPVLGIQVGQFATSYSADITVTTGQLTGLNTISYNNLEVENVQRTGPDIFSIGQQEACIFCGDWIVEADIMCTRDGEQVYSKQRTLTGQGGASDTITISGLPAGAQCEVDTRMTTPSDHGGRQNPTAYFTTGE